MAYINNRPLNEQVVSSYLPDLSTASSAYAVSPFRGKIVRAYSVLQATISTSDATWTMEINGTAVTGVSVIVTASGSAAGDVDTGTPTGANYVNEGDTVEWISAGESSSTCDTMFYAVIDRD